MNANETNTLHEAIAGVLKSTTMRRLHDRGRSRAYEAEGRAFGGFWYADSCTSPRMTWAETQEMFDLVMEWVLVNVIPEQHQLRARRNRASLEQGKRSYDFCCGSFARPGGIISMTVKTRNGLRLSCLLHEIAHWCIVGGKPHGKDWQRVFVELVREFMGKDDAANLAREYGLLSTPKVRAPRRTFVWEYSDDDGLTWHICKRKEIEFTTSWAEPWARDGATGIKGWRGDDWVLVRASCTSTFRAEHQSLSS